MECVRDGSKADISVRLCHIKFIERNRKRQAGTRVLDSGEASLPVTNFGRPFESFVHNRHNRRVNQRARRLMDVDGRQKKKRGRNFEAKYRDSGTA
jgi:hypothetical protein